MKAPTVALATTEHEDRKRNGARTAAAIVLIILGALCVPVALVASEARGQLTSTSTFVNTLGPLAHDPAIQRYVSDQTASAILDAVNIPALTGQLVDGLTSLGTGPVTTRALRAVSGSLTAALTSVVRGRVDDFIHSSAFDSAWREALRVSHHQVTATLGGDSAALVAVGRDGSVRIPLDPLVQRATRELENNGFTLAAHIPPVHRSLTILPASSLGNLVAAYGILLLLGTWLPWISLGAIAAGLLIAPRFSPAMITASVAVLLSMVLVLALLAWARIFFVASLAPGTVPVGVASALWGAVTSGISGAAGAILVISAGVLVVSWASSSLRYPRAIRANVSHQLDRLRSRSESAGITTGRLGEWLHRYHRALWVAIALASAAVLVTVRPLTVALAVWTTLLALLALILVTMLQRPATEFSADDDKATPRSTGEPGAP